MYLDPSGFIKDHTEVALTENCPSLTELFFFFWGGVFRGGAKKLIKLSESNECL